MWVIEVKFERGSFSVKKLLNEVLIAFGNLIQKNFKIALNFNKLLRFNGLENSILTNPQKIYLIL